MGRLIVGKKIFKDNKNMVFQIERNYCILKKNNEKQFICDIIDKIF